LIVWQHCGVRPRHIVPALLLALTFTLAIEGVAAACGGVKHAPAVKRGDPGRAPLVIGDSVLLGAVSQVAAAGFEVNTRGCRQMREGLQIISARKRAKTLPHLVVIALGANGSIAYSQIREAMKLVGPDRVLGLVTPRELGGGQSSDARNVRAAGRRFPGRVVVLDWVRFSAGQGGWFAGDGLHLGPAGARGLARLLRGALALAIEPLCP
jgi:lysophospholipase L1-like esterase